jgi:hypothetical protein
MAWSHESPAQVTAHDELLVHVIAPVHDWPPAQSMMQVSAVQVMAWSHESAAQVTSHDEPPHEIAPVHDCPPVQLMSQLAAAVQSIVPGQSSCPQSTRQGTFAGQTTVGHAFALQSKTQTSPLQAPPATVHDSAQGAASGGRTIMSAGASTASPGASVASVGGGPSPVAAGGEYLHAVIKQRAKRSRTPRRYHPTGCSTGAR